MKKNAYPAYEHSHRKSHLSGYSYTGTYSTRKTEEIYINMWHSTGRWREIPACLFGLYGGKFACLPCLTC